MRPRGFTLVELLVTVVIIAIVASLLLSALPRVVETVRQRQCVSNLRQIGVGFQLYIADNDGAIPYNSSTANWINSVGAYITPNFTFNASTLGQRPPSVFRCPKGTTIITAGNHSDYGKNIATDGSYPAPPVKMMRISPASQVFLAGDSQQRDLAFYVNNGGFSGRHLNKANVLYCDFHVEPVDPTALPYTKYGVGPPWSSQ